MNKELIKRQFSKSIKTYEENAIVQKIMAQHLASLIAVKNYDCILELGCGTGFLTKELTQKIEYSVYDAIDIVDDCKKYIEQISKNIVFNSEDIENIIPDKKYDLIVSNASLQWLEDIEGYINRILSYLKPSGVLAFTIFGKENFYEMTDLIPTHLKYYSEKDIQNMCKNYNIISIQTKKNILEFENPKDILYHMKNTGVNAISKTTWKKSDLEHFIKNYPSVDSKYTLTYNPIYVVLNKI